MNEEQETRVATAPETFPLFAFGFANTTEAESFANYIAYTVRLISRYIDLSRLDGITVAFDYDEALARLDRGYQSARTLTRTYGDRATGVAMAPAVIRDGVVKGHLVFDASWVLPIQDESHEHFHQALYLIAHECAHIEELLWRDVRFPGVILQAAITDDEDSILSRYSETMWSEYAACRLSATFGAEQAPLYEEGLVGALSAARKEANCAIRLYRSHGDLNRVLEEAGRPLCDPLRFAAYLIGHLDGCSESWDAVPTARDNLADSEYAPFIERMTKELRCIWDSSASWETLAVFDPLKDVARNVLKMGGVILTRKDNGVLYVDIPYADDTMPTVLDLHF